MLISGGAKAPPATDADIAADNLFAQLSSQQSKLPQAVKQGLYLTSLTLDTTQRSVYRTYVAANFDFGRSSAKVARNITGSITAELLRQCQDHQEYIFDSDISFHYRFVDSHERVFAVNIIDKTRCQMSTSS